MNDIAIEVSHVWKKFRKGEIHDSLRDLIPALTRRLVRRDSNSNELGESEFWALKDVSFQVRRGEALGIIGPNGSGKSTVLKILSRIVRPNRGHYRANGRVQALIDVDAGFHNDLTGRENIYLNGSILGMKKLEIAQRLDAIIDFSGIEAFIDTPTKRYSSGMRARLGFSIMAHMDPDILLVDEVLAVGDAAFRRTCLEKMAEFAVENRTVIFVTHNMGALKALCGRAIVLQNGIILADRTATEAVTFYMKTIEQAPSCELSQWQRRKGSGGSRLTRVEIVNGTPNSSTTLATGQPAQFVFHVTSVLPHMSCLFTIYDQQAQPVAHFNSAVRSQEDASDSKIGFKFICELDQLPLLPGRYHVNVAIRRPGVLEDLVEPAAVFEVEHGELRGRPVTYDHRDGIVALQHRWVLPANS